MDLWSTHVILMKGTFWLPRYPHNDFRIQVLTLTTAAWLPAVTEACREGIVQLDQPMFTSCSLFSKLCTTHVQLISQVLAILGHEVFRSSHIEVWLESVDMQEDRVSLFRQTKEP